MSPLLLSPILVSLAFILLAPWYHGTLGPDPAWDPRVPIVLVASDPMSAAKVEGFDAAAASRRVAEGAARQLRARGVGIEIREEGIVVGPHLPEGTGPMAPGGGRAAGEQGRKRVVLDVGFGRSSLSQTSGTETRFGGEGDAAWRLAARAQRHLVGGLRDVLGYDSYDRGVVQQMAAPGPRPSPPGFLEGDQWVQVIPLFATNPRERDLLQWPQTLDLLSAALANAIYEYATPTLPTPPRDSRHGWRLSAPWQPVPPRVLFRAEQATRVALTFDGGASSVPTPPILKALRDSGVRATMFMTLDYVQRNPDLVLAMAKDGHEFGNHSSTHPDMTTLSTPAIISELDRLESAVYALTGKSTRPWFRPPFGASNDRLVRTVAEQGYYTIMWTADSADWRPEVAAETVQRRLLTYASPGAIMIQHLGSPQSAQVMPEVLRLLMAQGVECGALSEVLGSLD